MQEIINNCIAGDGLKSNWPEMPACNPRKTIEKYCVDDENGITVFASLDLQLARRVAKETHNTLRYFVMDDEEQSHENRLNREEWKHQFGKSH